MLIEGESGRIDADRFLAAEQELQSFSYIVSHDLAASFRHVSAFSRLLVDELAEDATERQRAQAVHIRAATENCQAMMEQLLVYSRVQQGAFRRVRQDANALFQAAMPGLAARSNGPDAEIRLEPLGDVYADSQLLALAFKHLLDNALKFVRPGAPPRIVVA
jgi:light-regulated signal transduction histidine kinase (bacteriophytochrome)